MYTPPCQPYWGSLGQKQVNGNNSNSLTVIVFLEYSLCVNVYIAPMVSQKCDKIGQVGGALLYSPCT